MKDTPISRRDFLKNMGIAGAGAFLAASPWLSAFSEVTNTSSEKCRLAIIGPGSRGRFLMSFLVKNPKVDIVALCDIYQPSIDEALKLAPKAKVYGNYKEVLEDKNIDAVLVATPLSAHYKIVMDAFDIYGNTLPSYNRLTFRRIHVSRHQKHPSLFYSEH